MLLRRLIGLALRRARLAQGRTLREVADAARVSVPYLSELERGRKEGSSEVLAAICRALDLTLGDLLDQVRDELSRLQPETVTGTLSAPAPLRASGATAPSATGQWPRAEVLSTRHHGVLLGRRPGTTRLLPVHGTPPAAYPRACEAAVTTDRPERHLVPVS